jgi:hypothetical protein
LPAQERRPIIVKIAKGSGDVDRAHFNLLQASVLKQLGQRGWLAIAKRRPSLSSKAL